jgi:hypothetical protein
MVAEAIHGCEPDSGSELSSGFAWCLAQRWIDAWNAHDLDAILGFYDDEPELTLPSFVSAGMRRRVVGRDGLRAVFESMLKARPDLRLELLDARAGVRTVTLDYATSHGRRGTEVLVLRSDGRVLRTIWNAASLAA